MTKGKFPNERKEYTTPKMEVVEPKPTHGVVDNCNALVMRAKPEADAEIISVMSAGVELLVCMDESTDEFYKVFNELGGAGYCKREFVTIK